jgi:hypothetical protein
MNPLLKKPAGGEFKKTKFGDSMPSTVCTGQDPDDKFREEFVGAGWIQKPDTGAGSNDKFQNAPATRFELNNAIANLRKEFHLELTTRDTEAREENAAVLHDLTNLFEQCESLGNISARLESSHDVERALNRDKFEALVEIGEEENALASHLEERLDRLTDHVNRELGANTLYMSAQPSPAVGVVLVPSTEEPTRLSQDNRKGLFDALKALKVDFHPFEQDWILVRMAIDILNTFSKEKK